MALNVVYGKAGSGKSTYLFDYIKSNLNKEKIYVITPEQFSFTAEKKLLEVVKTGAVVNAEVLTFNRMAYRVLNEVGGITKTNLLASGKAMLIYEILLEQKNKFNFIGKSNENVELISTQITEFKKHRISVKNLQNITENTKDMYLKLKMQDMQAIYDIYEQSLKNNYIDENDILTILAEKLVKSNLFDGTTIILDEFAGFTKQEYNIIKILLNKAKNIIVTICTDSLNESENKETDIFYANKQTWFKLLDVCQENGIKIGKQINMGETKRFKNAELRHLEKNVYSIPYHKYEPKVENISLFLANNPYSEVEHLAKQIVKLVKNEDYRYKEIAVITKNIDTYSNLCKAIFKKYDIPVFIDEKKDLTQNVLVKFVLSVIDIFIQNWSYESVFSYIKTGLVDIDMDTAYYLENYCLKWGIKGSKWYKGEWNFYDESEEEIQKIKYARSIIVEPLMRFKNDLLGIKDVKSITKKLYEYLIQNNIPKKLEEKIEKLLEIEELEIAKEYESSFKILTQVFDEIVLVLGESKVTFEKYAEILKIGLRNSDLGKIPTSQDEVIIGDIDRSRSHKVKAVFIIGVNDGVFPTINKNEGFFDDSDREKLKKDGIELAKGTTEKLYDDNFNIYKALTTAEEKLYLSSAKRRQMWGEYKYYNPSRFIDEIPRQLLNSIGFEGSTSGTSTFQNAVSKARTGKSDFSYSAAQSDSYGYVKPSSGFGKGFVAPTKGLATGNSQSDRQKQNSSYYNKPQRTPSRTILVKSKENKQRDEEKVKEFFKDNAIKRMLEEKKQKERMQQEAEAERQKKMETTAPIEYVFNEGERVFHDKLGIGHIKEVTQIGDSMMYTIDFGRQGIKAMDAAYAKLKKF